MTFFQFLQSLLRKNQSIPVNTSFDCPNCWGIQQWENEYRGAHFDNTKDTSSITKSRQGFIQRFADRYVPVIRKPRRT
ncbi:MAG: hypothetical protein ACRBG0_10460 [Lewinella sp.]|jgi:hypothetical protein|uniref:hypothetical protein n=1 Tax=Lewinella sp. TaxID=2004506 RepID=UPI003D6A3B43